MKRSVLRSFILSTALMTLPFGHMALASGTKVRHTIVAALGAAAPEGGNYLFFLNARLNPRSEVVFDAVLTGPSHTGVFILHRKTTSAIALGGNPDPAAENFGVVLNPFLTRNGNVVFEVNGNSIFTGNARGIVPLVQNGDQAPGGGTMAPQAQSLVANDGGVAAYLALVSDSTATQGIFRTDGMETVSIARDDIGAPTGGNFTSLFGPAINNRGQVAFFAEMSGGTADFGIFRGDGGDVTPVFVANQIAPAGGVFSDFGEPKINVHGQIAAPGILTDGSTGLFLSDGTNAIAIALEGRPAPKGGNYGTRNAFPGPLRLNDRGEVAFHAHLAGGTSGEGVFRGDGERTTTVALAGAIAPGTTGRFDQFKDIKLGNNGRVAFIAALAVGVGGVDFSNNVGIWVGTSDEDLQLVVRTGEVIGGNVLTGLPEAFDAPNQFDMNENAVVWIGSFQSPARAVVLSRMIGEK